MMWRLWGMVGAAALLAAAVCVDVSGARADKVGVAAAVNPDAFSRLAGSPQTQLNIGKSIFFNERINTTTSGLVQVLLVDGSTFTVGPGSDLVIDKFVYDPKKQTGEVVASFSKGVMRFVGGKISKNENGVTVNTPAGALAIRGGMFQAQLAGSKGIFSFLYGVSMTLANKYSVYEPGYTIDTRAGVPDIRPTTTADISAIMAALTNRNTGGIGGSGTEDGGAKTGGKSTSVETVSLQDMISDATGTQINDTIQTQIDNATQKDQPPAEVPPPSTDVPLRVLLSPGVYTAFPGTSLEYTTDNASNQGILGGGTYPAGTQAPLSDDFNWTFQIANGRLTGIVSGLTDAHCVDGNCENIETSTPPDAHVDFPATLDCLDGICAILPKDNATVTQNGQTTTYTGVAVLKTDFYAYDLIGAANSNDQGGPSSDPVLAFGGKGYNFGTPSGKTYAFLLLPDVKEGVLAPFAGSASFPKIPTDQNGNPVGPLPTVSPLLYLEKDSPAANDPSHAVWLQTSLYINTTPGSQTPFDQESFVNIALGGVDPVSGGLIGARRGGSSAYVPNFDCNGVDCGTHRDQVAFTGDIATLAGPDGSHFLGKDNPNIVIGFDTTGTHNIGRDIPLVPLVSGVENQSGSTYHIGVGSGSLPQPANGPFQGTVQGYAVGMVQSEVPVGFRNAVASTSPSDFKITFDPVTNSLFADVIVRDVQNSDGATSSYEFKLGDVSGNPAIPPSNKSAYIDNLHYAAIEAGPGATTVLNGGAAYTQANATAYLVSGDQLNATSFFPDTFLETASGSGVRPFCNNCEFLKWGAWGARAEFGNSNPSEFVDNIHTGWWVAGDLASAGNPGADLDKLAATNASASYTGHAIGNVASNINGNWKTYVAAGNLNMQWNFGPRQGTLAINNFDATGPKGPLNVSGQMSTPGVLTNQFGGNLNGTLGASAIAGSATGSFVNNGPSNPAAGVLGNFNVGSNSNGYKATGIFAGSGTPVAGTPGPVIH